MLNAFRFRLRNRPEMPLSLATVISCLVFLIYALTLPTQQPPMHAQGSKAVKDSQQDDRMDFLTNQLKQVTETGTAARAMRDAQVEGLRSRIVDLNTKIDQAKLDEAKELAAQDKEISLVREESAGHYGMIQGACLLITFLSGAGLLVSLKSARKVSI